MAVSSECDPARRITTDPAVCHGQPTIRGLRYTVETVLEVLAAGMRVDKVLADGPDFERDDSVAVLEFGARASGRAHEVIGHLARPLAIKHPRSGIDRWHASSMRRAVVQCWSRD